MSTLSLFNVNPTSTQPLTVPDKMLAWSKVDTRSTKKRYLHSSIIWKHYIITYGGSTTNDGANDAFGDVIIFNINTYQWGRAKIRGRIPQARYGHTACLYNEDQMIVYGGYSGSNTMSDILVMTPDESNCKNLPLGELEYLIFYKKK